jgi:NTE family protein
MLGLVLTAGGARGAYQAGVLKRIGEIPALQGRPSPFQIIAGASAGAINGTMIAAGSGDPRGTSSELARLWSELQVRDVFRVDLGSLTAGGLRWLQDLSLGGLFGGGNAQSLLDTTPLRTFLQNKFPASGIADSIRAGHLFALAVSATCYYTGKSFTFIQGRSGHPLWQKARRVTLPVEITLDHVLASSAIPIIFPPVFVKTPVGDFYFGDGGLRLITPLSPAIRLGAERLFAIGIRSQRAAEERTRESLFEAGADGDLPSMRKPPLAQIFGVFLNAIFLDHLDTDLDHLRRMNELIYYFGSVQYGPDAAQAVGRAGTGGRAPGPAAGERPSMSEPMRIVLPYVVNPSEDLASVAETYANRMPRMVRFAMEGLGTSRASSADLLSYLLFDSDYTRALIDIGYRDAGAQIDQIETFLLDPRAAAQASTAA